MKLYRSNIQYASGIFDNEKIKPLALSLLSALKAGAPHDEPFNPLELSSLHNFNCLFTKDGDRMVFDSVSFGIPIKLKPIDIGVGSSGISTYIIHVNLSAHGSPYITGRLSWMAGDRKPLQIEERSTQAKHIKDLINKIQEFADAHQSNYVVIGEDYPNENHKGLVAWITGNTDRDMSANGIWKHILEYYQCNTMVDGVRNQTIYRLNAEGDFGDFRFQHHLTNITYGSTFPGEEFINQQSLHFYSGGPHDIHYHYITTEDPVRLNLWLVKYFIQEMNCAISDGKMCDDAFRMKYIGDTDITANTYTFPCMWDIWVFEEIKDDNE
jgi:hypothetical protein